MVIVGHEESHGCGEVRLGACRNPVKYSNYDMLYKNGDYMVVCRKF